MKKWFFAVALTTVLLSVLPIKKVCALTYEGLDKLRGVIKNTPGRDLGKLKGRTFDIELIDEYGTEYNWLQLSPEEAFEIKKTGKNTFTVTIIDPSKLVVVIGGLEQRADIVVSYSEPVKAVVGGLSDCSFPLTFYQETGRELVFADIVDEWENTFKYDDKILALYRDLENNIITVKRKKGFEKTKANVQLILRHKTQGRIQKSRTIEIPQCSDNEETITVQRKAGHCIVEGGSEVTLGKKIKGYRSFINTCPRSIKFQYNIKYYVEQKYDNKTTIATRRHFAGIQPYSSVKIDTNYSFPKKYNKQSLYFGQNTQPITDAVREDLGWKKEFDFHAQWAESSDVKAESRADQYLHRANAYKKRKEHREALKWYRNAFEEGPADYVRPANALAWFFVSCPNAHFRDGEAAISLAKKAIALKRDPEYLDTLACAYAEIGMFSKAIEIEQEAFRLKPKDHYRKMIEAFRQRKTYVDVTF
ncbi:MAG: hypothetical protein JRJ47_00960 [Deltaproteobacteria bacterium]|nr:hypothetical protein [Deltaproteobacteria bacterium]